MISADCYVILRLSFFFPELCRCHAELFLEMQVEILDGVESREVGYFVHAACGGLQQLGCPFQPDGTDELQGREVDNGLHFAVQLGLAHPHVQAQVAHGVFRIADVLLDGFQGFLHQLLVYRSRGDGLERHVDGLAEHLLPPFFLLDELADAHLQHFPVERFRDIRIRPCFVSPDARIIGTAGRKQDERDM